MNRIAAADVVIIGGGIAGLWLLNRIRQKGLNVILFESSALGGGQTYKSQGIIHGGTKYALNGLLTNEAKAMADMPLVWKKCLAGDGEINLTDVSVLSQHQYLWSPNKVGAKLTGFLASTFLQSKVETLPLKQYPAVFQNDAFNGQVYALEEVVLDVPTLVRELVKNNQDAIFKIEPLSGEGFKFTSAGELSAITLYHAGKAIKVNAQQFIFTAGAGNESILKYLKIKQVAMQRRPLHMVLVKCPFNFPLYAHCLGLGNRPRLTITTHHAQDGTPIWYLGGQLAEDGVTRNSAQQIQAALAELNQLFPWLDFAKAEWSTFMVDRAEPKQNNYMKPENAFVAFEKNMIIGWPTKLALAPKLAADVLAHFESLLLRPKYLDTRDLRIWPMPPIAKPVWEEMFCKDVA